MHFFIAQNGEPALRLLFADLRGNGPAGAEAALLSVTGYGLSEWNARWQRFLREPVKPSAEAPLHAVAAACPRGCRASSTTRGSARRSRSRPRVREPKSSRCSVRCLGCPQVRARVASGLYAAGDDAGAERALGTVAEIDGLYGPWFALAGRGFKRRGQLAEADPAFTLGLSADPLSDEVACEGYADRRNRAVEAGVGTGPDARSDVKEPPLPTRAAWLELCKAARMVPRD